MTRKDYNLLASAIRESMDECRAQYNEDVEVAIRLLTSRLASRLQTDNPRFDRQKFYKAAIGQ